MPRYDYKCPECGKVEERSVTLENRDRQKCGHHVATDDCGQCDGNLPGGCEDCIIVCDATMVRLPHFKDVSLQCPETFLVNNRDYTDPDRTPGCRQAWDEACGLKSRKLY